MTWKCTQIDHDKANKNKRPGESIIDDILAEAEQVFGYSKILQIKKTGPAESYTLKAVPRQRHMPEQKPADVKQKTLQDVVWPTFKIFVLVRDYLMAPNQEIANLVKSGCAIADQQDAQITQKAVGAGFSEKEAEILNTHYFDLHKPGLCSLGRFTIALSSNYSAKCTPLIIERSGWGNFTKEQGNR